MMVRQDTPLVVTDPLRPLVTRMIVTTDVLHPLGTDTRPIILVLLVSDPEALLQVGPHHVCEMISTGLLSGTSFIIFDRHLPLSL